MNLFEKQLNNLQFCYWEPHVLQYVVKTNPLPEKKNNTYLKKIQGKIRWVALFFCSRLSRFMQHLEIRKYFELV